MGGKSMDTLATSGSAWIDVRDLAQARVLAIEKSEAGGERIIVSQALLVWQDWIEPFPLSYPSLFLHL
jgi:nucleoside-diphosphate-sugar epimerase